MQKQTLILDSSQIAAHFECSELWNLEYRQHLTDTQELDEAMTQGTYGHKLLEIYYKTKDTVGVPAAVKAALIFNPDKADKVDETFPLSPEVRKKIQERFKDYWMKYCSNDYTTLTRKEHVICVDESGNPFDTYPSVPIIEKGFSYLLLDSKEYLFVLEGKIDWIAQTPIGKAFIDHKFQLRSRELYNKSIQFKNYALASGLNIGIINYIRLKDKLDDKTLVRTPITFDAMELTWWKQELIEVFVKIAKETKYNHFPRNWGSCSGKFDYECTYTKLCNNAKSPRLYQAIKSSMFKRKEWKPW